ncbi:hypothetical protein [Saccharothrix deserti]|uniref:hypothetical protein n=1 Tax=Saccharothrix deserti TaxID=2593674 RepID=UPI00131ECB92|nr:hypothetical protein [Saccharothrix deserti]
MTRQYPIVEHRTLDPTAGRGPLRVGRRRRDLAELPKPAAHEVMVFRVDGDYFVDAGRLGLADEQVVRAAHVSVVDLGRDVPVVVSLRIPSAEAADFTVRVTFTCTVLDPVAVVRDGLEHAETLLTSYLTGHHRTFELGLEHRLSEINEVRRVVAAQVRAFTEVRPVVVRGVAVRLASVEVLTPDELVEFEKRRRGQVRDQTLDRTVEQTRQHHRHDLEVETQLHQALLTARQHDELRRRQWERDDQLRLLRWKRDDEQRREKASREDRRRMLDTKLALVRELARRGHLDTANVGVDGLLDQLTAGPLPPGLPADEPVDDVREEDEV